MRTAKEEVKETAQAAEQEEVKEEVELTEAEKAAKLQAYYDEKIEVQLFKDNGKYQDDVFVAVNGKGMTVPRGKKVMIPRKYALALMNSQHQDSLAADMIAQLQETQVIN